MHIPFVDLKSQYNSIKDEIDASIKNVINETAFIKGRYVQDFEEKYAAAYGVEHCITCGNGTDAIYIVLKSLGIGIGDEVITVANTWISTAETISQVGAKPIFVDIDKDYFNIDSLKIEEKITNKTKAIIAVHLFGQPANMDLITTLCNKYNLFLIEDCAQSHFAEWKGSKVGTFGVAGTFSFFPGKNLGAYGDAGAIITNDDKLSEIIRMFSNHGQRKKHDHQIQGINSRMDGIQASILSVKLKYIKQWSKKRLEKAKMYSSLLSNIENIETPKIHPDVNHVFHLYVIRSIYRDRLIKKLNKNGVETGIHYPMPLPFIKAYRYLNHNPEDFPVAYDYKDKIISIPIFPELSSDQIKYITDLIIRYSK